MSLSEDISPLLAAWKHDPNRVNARWITGEDGKPKVQLRLDLGVLQMELDSRPDGTTPRGYRTLLDYHLALEARSLPDHPALRLDDDACGELQQEAVQFYYRYLCFHALGYIEGVIRDTGHNLNLFRFVAQHAADEDYAWQFLQFYPYLRMMNARAMAEQALRVKDHQTAVTSLEEGIHDIRLFWREYGDEEDDDETPCEEIELLARVRESLRRRKPKTKADRLREHLDKAIASENYEQAAVLRDALRKLDV